MSELPREIEDALRVLDAQAAQRAGRVNPEWVATRVLQRLRMERSPRRWAPLFGAPLYLRVAAAALVVVTAGGLATYALRGGGGVSGVALPLAASAVDSLDQGQVEAVLQAVDQIRPLNGAAPSPSYMSLEEMSEEQLRAVLQAMQTLEGTL